MPETKNKDHGEKSLKNKPLGENINIKPIAMVIWGRARNGDIIVANFNGCFVCKLIDKQQARLLSASKHHKPVAITPDDDFQLEGVVTRSIRLHHQAPEFSACIA